MFFTCMRAVCKVVCHWVAFSQARSHSSLILSIRFVVSSDLVSLHECSVKWPPITLIDIIRDLWLSSSIRNSRWSYKVKRGLKQKKKKIQPTIIIKLRPTTFWKMNCNKKCLFYPLLIQIPNPFECFILTCKMLRTEKDERTLIRSKLN